MIDIDSLALDVPCPACPFSNRVTLRQVRLRSVVICRGCKANIRLEDHLNTTRKAARSVARALRGFRAQLDGIGTITISI